MNTKSVIISIVGRANVGKSSLTNLLVGEKIAIISEKPQTTRTRINGVLTKEEMQYVFIDTPGMHRAKTKLSQQMIKSIRASVLDVDAVFLTVDATKRIGQIEYSFIESFKNKNLNAVLLMNKVDLVKDKLQLLAIIDEYSKLYPFAEIIPISVKNNVNIDQILPAADKFAKEGEHLFPDDLPTDQSEKIWLAEIVREKILQSMYEEIPHGVAVIIESLEYGKTTKNEDIADVGVVIVCEKQSHKGMVIGKQGALLKKIGSIARAEMEDYFGTKVNMKIWVRVKEDWRNSDALITEFGLNAE